MRVGIQEGFAVCVLAPTAKQNNGLEKSKSMQRINFCAKSVVRDVTDRVKFF